MMTRSFLPHAVFAVLSLGLVLTACEHRAAGVNIVIVTLDTTRADRLGAMGDVTAQTPVLDRLASRGVVFERAYASAPLTLPSHVTVFTGLDPPTHGIHDNQGFVLRPSVETVTERLRARGYATAAFVSAFVLKSLFGLDQGFAVYDDDVSLDREPLRFRVPDRKGELTTDRALAWLSGQERRAPFFLWVHYYDVHHPRRPPPPFDQLDDPYAGELAYVDSQVGRLLDGVAEAASGRDTLIVVVGDHGESLGEHRELTHGYLAYDSTLHVPLIVAGPGFPEGSRTRVMARTVDIAPTILAAIGEPPLALSEGRPLQDALKETRDAKVVGYFESFGPKYSMGWARIGGVRSGRWKYTAEPEPVELYDVVDDPDETVNRASDEPGIVAAMDDHYTAIRSAAVKPLDTRASGSGKLAEKLAALGYVRAAQQFDPDEIPDPRQVVGIVGLIESSRQLALDGRVADAIEALEILARKRVAASLALTSLGPLYVQAERFDDAIAAYERLVELTGTIEARIGMANALLAADRADAALRETEQLLSQVTVFSRPIALLRGQALLDLDRVEEAVRAASLLLEENPTDDSALALLSRARALRDGKATEIDRLQAFLSESEGSLRLVETRAVLAMLLRQERRNAQAVRILEAVPEPPPEHQVILAEIAAEEGNLPKAAKRYESLIDLRPATRGYQQALADIYDRLGRFDDSLALYDRMIRVDPQDATLYVNRGAARQRVGRKADAEADYRKAISLAPDLPEPYLNLALLSLDAGHENEAEALLRRAIELRPSYSKAHLQLARIYNRRGDPRAATHSKSAVAAAGPLPVSQPTGP